MPRTAVRISHITKTYPGGREIFEDVTFEVALGELIALGGPVGSGKTTLLSLISGLERFDGGEIFIDEEPISNLSTDELARMRLSKFGILFQNQNLVQELSVRQNVEIPLVLKGVKKEERTKKVDEALRSFGLLDDQTRKVKVLSIGERQLVAIARALITNPPIVLMDEPTESLDPTTREIIVSLIRGSNLLKNKTSIIATHDRSIMDIATRFIRIRRRIHEDDEIVFPKDEERERMVPPKPIYKSQQLNLLQQHH
jgi:ABC-type lipoprotein export system ATPase subunit